MQNLQDVGLPLLAQAPNRNRLESGPDLSILVVASLNRWRLSLWRDIVNITLRVMEGEEVAAGLLG